MSVWDLSNRQRQQTTTSPGTLCDHTDQWLCQTPSKTQANKQTDKETRPFVCLFVHRVCQRHPSYGWTKCDASLKFKGEDKNPGSTTKYTKFGQLVIGKIIKYCQQMSHLKAKMHQILFLASVCSNSFRQIWIHCCSGLRIGRCCLILRNVRLCTSVITIIIWTIL